MRVVFLGVGEACDERLPNTSLWIQTQVDKQRKSVLLDCGFTVPSLYWQKTSNPEDLDALWISHFHGDHFFGVPALLLRFWEMKRTKPLVIVGQSGVESILRQAMELAYPGFIKKLAYPIEFNEMEPGQRVRAVGLEWRTAQSNHGQKNLAVRIEDGQHSVFYGGDGPSSWPKPAAWRFMKHFGWTLLLQGMALCGNASNLPGRWVLQSWHSCMSSGMKEGSDMEISWGC
jgi:ribonuclease Z